MHWKMVNYKKFELLHFLQQFKMKVNEKLKEI